mmetsp:Transcript_24421/g.56793  ORF Transcript_24421/g.56793 Transcript_24421/m.56793 type:complete len:288 (+) Transcript_24421:848-1711(+)
MCLARDHTQCVRPHALLPEGDVFSVRQLTQLVLPDGSLDTKRGGNETSYRYDGLTLKLRVGYSSPHRYDYYLSHNDLAYKDISVAPAGSAIVGAGVGVGGEPPQRTRTLYDVHGIQLLLSHDGELGHFQLMQLLVALITGVGLLSVAKVATDMMLMYLLPRRAQYRLFVQDLTPDFSPADDEERAVLEQVLRAKRGERSFMQGKRPSEGLRAVMLEPSTTGAYDTPSAPELSPPYRDYPHGMQQYPGSSIVPHCAHAEHGPGASSIMAAHDAETSQGAVDSPSPHVD